MNTYRITKVVSLVIALTIGAGISYYYFSPKQTQEAQQASYEIVPFDDDRDMADALDIFTKDRYWLIASEDYNPEYALRSRSPGMQEDQYTGTMKISSLREGNAFVGLVTYYLKSILEGSILFLAVNEKYRGKRYAEKLMNHALGQLKAMGASIATLVTRTTNLRAQAVYNRLGFVETSRDNGFVYFAKQL